MVLGKKMDNINLKNNIFGKRSWVFSKGNLELG